MEQSDGETYGDDREQIRRLIEDWVIWRDSGDWDRFLTLWHPEGRMMATWFQGTAAEFAFAYTIDANRSLTFTLHEVYLALAKTPIEGPAGVEAAFEFRAAFNATATRMMTAVLRNQQAGTEYA